GHGRIGHLALLDMYKYPSRNSQEWGRATTATCQKSGPAKQHYTTEMHTRTPSPPATPRDVSSTPRHLHQRPTPPLHLLHHHPFINRQIKKAREFYPQRHFPHPIIYPKKCATSTSYNPHTLSSNQLP
ncbi:hypothetical protein MTR_0015s0020, partial [Medicago truncatula]